MNSFSIKTKIIYGNNALNYLEKFKDSKVFVVADPYLVESRKIDIVTNHLNIEKSFIFSKVEPDPHTGLIIDGVEDIKAFGPEGIVAVGGGSAIDTAKAIINMAGKLEAKEKPEFIAIPTTSGTGSEVTSFAVITDREKNVKIPLIDDEMIPDVAILEDEFLKTIPKTIVADTGMDVLTHAIEAYVATNASEFSDAYAKQAIRMVFDYLQRSYRDANDMEARRKMHAASCMAGIAFNNAGLGLNHALAHSIGGIFHISHGKINSVLLTNVIKFNSTVAAKEYEKLAKVFGINISSHTLCVKGIEREIKNLQQKLNMPMNLCECGISKEALINRKDEIIKGALNDACIRTNPRIVSQSDLEKMYDGLLCKPEMLRR